MCLSKAYVDRNGERELIMEEIALLEFENGKLQVRTLFGEQREIEATIREINFLNSSIILESPAA